MKNTIIKTVLLVISIQILVYSATVNGRLVVLTNNGTTYSVKAQLNTNTGTDDLGGATIILNFNNTNLSYSGVYSFHNFSGGTYSVATITNPSANQLRINIELNTDYAGTVVSQAPSWTDLVTINFNTLNASGSAGLAWQTSAIDWAIYDGDNNTFWTNGTFTNEDTTPLPVEIASFSVSLEKGNSILNWLTASEINNYGFDIERAIESKDKWQKIGFVQGHGNSNSPKDYSFEDSNPPSGKVKYRLKQIDFDGRFEYSDEIEVFIEGPSAYVLEQNQPNPFNPETTIKYSIPGNEFVTLKVYDLLGREITTLVNEQKPAGNYSVNFNANNIASGVYLYKLNAGKFQQINKMLLIK